jgi:glutamate dehydrogenase
MAFRGEKEKAALIDRLAARVRRRKDDEGVADAARFLRDFYRHVVPDDILALNPADLVGAAGSIWDHLQVRKPGQPKIRIVNPVAERDGWALPHTVIEIVNDDMPFLVDSVTAELLRLRLVVHLVIHPVIRVRRNKSGRLLELCDPKVEGRDITTESMMHIAVGPPVQGDFQRTIIDGLESVLSDVRLSVEDWPPMRRRLAEIVAELCESPPPVEKPEIDEAVAFLDWLDDANFTFTGYREYGFSAIGERTKLSIVPNSGLGILRDPDRTIFEGISDGVTLPEEVAQFVREAPLGLVSKANGRSTVHRSVHIDTIAIKKFGPDGKLVGERLFVGLFTSAVFHQSVRAIPLVRRKVNAVLARSGFAPDGHNGKALFHVLETLPRDDMFQFADGDLFDTAIGILHLQERPRVALFVRRDPFERFISCLIYIPRERYTTSMRGRMQRIVEEGFGGRITVFYIQVGEGPLARLQFIVRTGAGVAAAHSVEEIEAKLIEAGRDWPDDLRKALAARHGEARGSTLFMIYRSAFPGGYRERFSSEAALNDIIKLEEVIRAGVVDVDLYRPDTAGPHELRLKVFHRDTPLPLSDMLPVLENMGFMVLDEMPHQITSASRQAVVWLHDIGLIAQSGSAAELARIKANFEAAFQRVWQRDIENDGFNRLILAGLTWRQIVILRTYCKYLLQTNIPFGQAQVAQALAANAAIACDIVALFESLFDPNAQAGAPGAATKIRARIERALVSVQSLDDDRILRRYLNAVDSTLRTNYFQTGADGAPKPYLAVKLDSKKLDELPLPRPLVEIFVYSPRVEAIHLRGGRVARGGIRWSDRQADFRTEILGLMKAQMTKNAVIVPVGAKGGFFVKQPPTSGEREAVQAEGVACYQIFMRGLLDLTDNLVRGEIAPPKDVVRLDGDDPYLVVAADKGTATFSDIANGVARDYGFWLDDAFASGGSAGYDHKKMGITARGAWESVTRHFRELGIETRKTDFTVAGVGDMAGDVFGNGMLLSPHIKLVAAFNHLHIFIDPAPDSAKSIAERRRLFEMPRSTWADYKPDLISAGGGVFERKSKSIKVTREMRDLLDLGPKEMIAPNDLVRAILSARVDLLWFGGIGAFVKASDETHADVGDRINDGLRVNGAQLRAKVVAEGANLGVTQKGRIECALAGGRINTDFIDNSAGVSTSDHEVNIKILLGAAVAAKKLTLDARNKLLAEMTDELAGLVLLDNYRQTMALTHTAARGVAILDEAMRLMRGLERTGRLNRQVEFLPDDEALAERRAMKKGLTRPELAILLAYSKLTLFEDLMATDLPDEPFLAADVGLYFPKALRKSYGDQMTRHRLRREITATYLTNSLVNRAGPTFVSEVAGVTGGGPADVAKAYLVIRQVFGLRPIWAEIEALDFKIPAEVQTALALEILELIRRATVWMLRSGPKPLDLARTVARYADGIGRLRSHIADFVPAPLRDSIRQNVEAFVAKGVPETLASRVATLDVLFSGFDIVRISVDTGNPVDAVAKAYFALGAKCGFDFLREAAERLTPETTWQANAIAALVEDLYAEQTELTVKIVETAGGATAADAVFDAWQTANGRGFGRVQGIVDELRRIGAVDFAMLSVANREIRALLEAH